MVVLDGHKDISASTLCCPYPARGSPDPPPPTLHSLVRDEHRDLGAVLAGHKHLRHLIVVGVVRHLQPASAKRGVATQRKHSASAPCHHDVRLCMLLPLVGESCACACMQRPCVLLHACCCMHACMHGLRACA